MVFSELLALLFTLFFGVLCSLRMQPIFTRRPSTKVAGSWPRSMACRSREIREYDGCAASFSRCSRTGSSVSVTVGVEEFSATSGMQSSGSLSRVSIIVLSRVLQRLSKVSTLLLCSTLVIRFLWHLVSGPSLEQGKPAEACSLGFF